MKKGPRNIPDFSKKGKFNPHAPAPEGKVAPPTRGPNTVVKPKATSSKSGRRGS
jgi:hypothetical protein